ncbi:hypothetical protein EDF78_110124 [Rahnella sp. BIGb0236]|uniref:hypothetical protein n=1 Tax=Rahnella sp. BIGb0236 TaxID=2485117 RepID=UPI00105E6CFD|nr:hypothetical protein [Rahnella sp. BIGb0236]TDS88558.1 hypothetical protein EDF78_110124 [Rahnella sp. BIGb0236]
MHYVDYLVVGGELHGKVFNGLYDSQQIELPRDMQPMAQFCERDKPAPVSEVLTDKYSVQVHEYEGHYYLLATSGDISAQDIDVMIRNSKPANYK